MSYGWPLLAVPPKKSTFVAYLDHVESCSQTYSILNLKRMWPSPWIVPRPATLNAVPLHYSPGEALRAPEKPPALLPRVVLFVGVLCLPKSAETYATTTRLISNSGVSLVP